MSFGTWFLGPTHLPNSSALRKLDKMRNYPEGWAHGDGDRFSAVAVANARTILVAAGLLGYSRADVFPRRDGGFVATVYLGKDIHDFTVHRDGTLEWIHERDDVELACEPITLPEIQTKLADLARKQWDSYGYLSLTTTPAKKVVLSPPRSQNPAQIDPSPASIWIARSVHQAVLAST